MLRGMTRHILALDQGTTSSRSVLVNEKGELISSAQRDFTQHYPKPGWVEHDPEAIWNSQLATARKCVRGKIIDAIGLTNQRETTVLWNRTTGKPIAPAIVWQDRRTAALCEDLRRNRKENTFCKKTGLLLDPYFSGTKIRWLLDHVPGARKLAAKGDLAFGTIDSWLVWKLTRGESHITDVTNASRTLLFNIHTGSWDSTLLSLLDIPESILPRVVSCSGDLAMADKKWFGQPIPITGIAGDQQAALFGQACFSPGMIKNTYGTGCFLLMNTGGKPAVSKHKLLSTVAWKLASQSEAATANRAVAAALRLPRRSQTKADAVSPIVYALEGSVFSGGSVVQWLRDGLGIIKKSGDIEALARKVTDSGDVILVPAFTGLGAPVWDASARGLIIGVTRGTTAAHIARAAVECIAFQVADVVEAMQNDAHIPLKELRVDGGASVNNHLMQFQADLLGLPVVRSTNTESTAMGAAYLAGLGAGIWKSTKDISRLWKVDRIFEPKMKSSERGERRALWLKARGRATKWA